MLMLLKRRDFALLWSAGLVSIAGDKMLFIALPLHTYALTGSTLATGLMTVAAYAPRVLLGFIAGACVDRWGLKRTMVWANLLRALALLLLLAAHSPEMLWVVYIVAAVEAAISTFFDPAENALLPRLVAKDELIAANTLNGLNNNLALLVGPALGGMLFASSGLSGVALVDALTYLVGAGLIFLVSAASGPASRGREWAGSARARLRRDLIEGLRVVRGERALWTLIIVTAIAALGGGLLVPLWVPFLTGVLGGNEVYVGLLFSAQALGALPGGLLVARYGGGFAPAHLLGWGLLAQGLVDLVLFGSASFGVPADVLKSLALVLVVLFGIPSIAWVASYQTLLQQWSPEQYRGRVFGAAAAVEAGCHLVGLSVAGPLGEGIGVVPTMVAAAGLEMFAALAALRLLSVSEAEFS